MTHRPTISFIIPTIARPTLRDLISQLRAEIGPDDEVLVIGDGPQPIARGILSFGDTRFHYWEYGPTRDKGNSQRDFGIYHATRDFLMFADDDDLYCAGAIAHARDLLASATDRPHCFRKLNGADITEYTKSWTVGGALFVPPNIPGKLGTWNVTQHIPQEQDAYFILGTMSHYRDKSIVGHNFDLYHVNPQEAIK